MRKTTLMLAAALAMTSVMIRPSEAAVGTAPTGLRDAADELITTESAQFVWNGRRYCWYDGGWHGPGWYWCGNAWRRGIGWGGPVGWRGWRRPVVGRPGVRPGRPGVHRPGGHRPGVNRPGGGRPGANRPGGNRPGANRPGGNRAGGGQRRGGNRQRGGR